MYNTANKMIKSVDNKNTFKILNPNKNNGPTIYNKTTNFAVGLSKRGAISTIHKVTDPKKFNLFKRITDSIIKKFKK
jgi:hypothetical protein